MGKELSSYTVEVRRTVFDSCLARCIYRRMPNSCINQELLQVMLAGRFCRATTNIPRVCSSVPFTRFSSSLRLSTPALTSALRPATQRIPQLSNRSFFATMAANTPYVTLNDGNKMPQVGFGLWKVDNATCADTVYNAIKTGYRLFDGACGTS